jgi:hypothetical protein
VDVTILAAIVAGLAGLLGALIGAGITLYWNYRERAAGQRQVLYEQQVIACVEIGRALAVFRSFGVQALHRNPAAVNGPWNREAKAQALRQVGPAYDLFREAWEGRSAILPEEVVDAMTLASDRFIKMFGPAQLDPPAHWPGGSAALDVFVRACLAVVPAMRKALGTEALTQQTLDRIEGSARGDGGAG